MSDISFTPKEEDIEAAQKVTLVLGELMTGFNQVLEKHGITDLRMKSFELTRHDFEVYSGACCCCPSSNVCCNGSC